MARTIGYVAALLLLAACGDEDLTSSIGKRDPDLTGRYQSGLGIVITDSVLYASGFGDGVSFGFVAGAYCPSEWILTQTRPREYAVTIHISAHPCRDSSSPIVDYLTLSPTITGVLHLDTVYWNSLASESVGTIIVGDGKAQEFQSLTGCAVSGLDAGWSISFQAYTTPDYTFENGWAYFLPRVPSTVQGQGPFRVQCRGIAGLFMHLGFNFLRLSN